MLPADRWKRETYYLKGDNMKQLLDTSQDIYTEAERANIDQVINRNKLGEFHYEAYESQLGDEPVDRVEWEWRDPSGKLHSGVEVSFEEAIKAAQRAGMKDERKEPN